MVEFLLYSWLILFDRFIYREFNFLIMVKSGFGLFEELFGKGFSKDDVYSGMHKAINPRAAAIQESFVQALASGDKKYLAKSVKDYEKDMRDSLNSDFMKAYGLGALLVDELDLAYDALVKFPRKRSVSEALALIKYTKEDYVLAAALFLGSDYRVQTSRVLHSLSIYNSKQKNSEDIGTHNFLLSPHLDSLAPANNILGVLNFNSEAYSSAVDYFAKAKELSESSEKTWLNWMRAMKADGLESEMYPEMPRFYALTGSSLGLEDLTAELDKNKLEMPVVKVKNLFGIVKQLLA